MIIPVGERFLVEPADNVSGGFDVPEHMKKDGLKWCKVIHNADHPVIQNGDLVFASAAALRKGFIKGNEFHLIAQRDVWAYLKQQ